MGLAWHARPLMTCQLLKIRICPRCQGLLSGEMPSPAEADQVPGYREDKDRRLGDQRLSFHNVLRAVQTPDAGICNSSHSQRDGQYRVRLPRERQSSLCWFLNNHLVYVWFCPIAVVRITDPNDRKRCAADGHNSRVDRQLSLAGAQIACIS